MKADSAGMKSSRFIGRRYRRFPVAFRVSYENGTLQGYGTAVDISLSGWSIIGDMPVEVGMTLTVDVEGSILLTPLTVDCAKVLWVRGHLFCINVEAARPEVRKELQKFVSVLARTR